MKGLVLRTLGGSLTTGQFVIVAGVVVVGIVAGVWLADRISKDHDIHVKVGGVSVDLA